jgi:hypothetical protein
MVVCSVLAFFVGGIGLFLVLSPLAARASGLELLGLGQVGIPAGGAAAVVLVNCRLLRAFGMSSHVDKFLKWFMRLAVFLIIGLVVLAYVLVGLAWVRQG